MIKSYMSDPFGRWLLILLTLIVAVSILVGFVIDAKGFSGNLLAELGGNGIAILAGLLLIDRFLEYRREQQWAKVRDFTFRAIATHLCEIAGYLFIYYPGLDYDTMEPIFAGHIEPPNRATLASFEDLLEQLRRLPDAISEDKSTSDIAIEYYRAVMWDLDQIQNVLTPRVMRSSSDQKLIDVLIEFDSARRELHHAIIAHKEAVTHSVFPDVLSLIQSSGHLYQAICERWETV